jgi:hypothetical protein
MVTDYPPRGTRQLYGQLDQRVVPTHPKTGEQMPPPASFSFTCSEESVGWTRARVMALIRSTGWALDGDIQESLLWKEDRDADRPQEE